MRRFGLLAVGLLLGCAHGQRLPIRVEREDTEGFDARADVSAGAGGVVASVQFVKFGGGASPVSIVARRVGEDDVELVFDYRKGMWKCASARAYRVEIAGLDPGPYEVVVRVGEGVLQRASVVVGATARKGVRGRMRHSGDAGC